MRLLLQIFASFVCFVVAPTVLRLTAILAAETPLDIGTRLEPFFDHYLIAELTNVTRTPGIPVSAGNVLTFDRPWEGRYAAYVTVIQDGPLLRLYYRGLPATDAPYVTWAQSNGVSTVERAQSNGVRLCSL
jgi:hypothetical protein